MQYGLIGEHLTHSFSPEIHAKIASYPYTLCELAPDALDDFFRKREFCAINVTIPYKERVIPYLDAVSETASRIGAVNTIVNRSGKLFGYNTDFAGMCAMLRHGGISISGKKVLILGTGGTSKTACAVAERLGADKVLRVSRSGREGAISYEKAQRDHADAQVLLNTTPVGMYPHTEHRPIAPDTFPALEGVADVIYHPLRTHLVLDAQKQGCSACGGLYMLVAQAVYAAGLFQNREPETETIDRVYREILSEMQNIVLIGMPSSGKTSVGQQLAEQIKKPFVDVDQEIITQIQMPISDYFAQHGEPAFRSLERKTIQALAKQNGCIIATGGGAILDASNVRALRQNGTLVFLNRSPEQLIPTADRPLSSNRDALAQRYRERYPLYRQAADVEVDGNGSVSEVTQAVWEKVKA